jgi:hypothetical protein
MSTLSNPSCVCDTHSPVEALLQRSTDWQALEPVTPPPVGVPSPDDVLRLDTKRHVWPVYLVNVPDEWEAISWRSVPPHTPSYKTAKTSAEIAAILNRERIRCSKDGYVSHWHIRVRMGGRYANLSLSLNTPWKPRNEYDLPPAFITIDGSREQCKQIVGELNNRLDQCPAGEKRKRAFIARSICPGDCQ